MGIGKDLAEAHRIQMKDRYNLPTGFGSAPIRQEGSAVSYDNGLATLRPTEKIHEFNADIDDAITLTEEEQND